MVNPAYLRSIKKVKQMTRQTAANAAEILKRIMALETQSEILTRIVRAPGFEIQITGPGGSVILPTGTPLRNSQIGFVTDYIEGLRKQIEDLTDSLGLLK